MVRCASDPEQPYSQAAQLKAVAEVAEMVAAGDGVLGVLLPSFLLCGAQPAPLPTRDASRGASPYGMSVTEPCLDWSSTVHALESLAAAVRASSGRPSTPHQDAPSAPKSLAAAVRAPPGRPPMAHRDAPPLWWQVRSRRAASSGAKKARVA